MLTAELKVLVLCCVVCTLGGECVCVCPWVSDVFLCGLTYLHSLCSGSCHMKATSSPYRLTVFKWQLNVRVYVMCVCVHIYMCVCICGHVGACVWCMFVYVPLFTRWF